ncbi:T-cell surface glycoprotein CD8 alpha chain [Salminus brasiliensis]|uniref:T-cell surface glycoprotein CD8 alpha chain n=1 Tax=Salminus brasiliensis TaxID=930266 RepID=UPI003B82E58E
MFGVSSGLLVLLLLFHGGCSEGVKDGEKVDIVCDPKIADQTVWWFRLMDKETMEFIAAFSAIRLKGELDSRYSHSKMKDKTLTLKAFKKEDSGFYSCMTIKNNQLFFGQVTKVQGIQEVKPPTARTTLVKPTVKTTPCESKNNASNLAHHLGCELMILIPLAAGSGLLLILLIITFIYCNRIRTRRCPHHHKRQPRNRPAGHRPLPHQPDF